MIRCIICSTGLSYSSGGKYASNDHEINNMLHEALVEFFRIHSKYISSTSADGVKRTRPFYMSGESHAGTLIH